MSYILAGSEYELKNYVLHENVMFYIKMSWQKNDLTKDPVGGK